jgi:prepilin signal peptidase PulO-like enzyme (type II secretory pathway)
MLTKIGGLARALAILLSIVAGFVALGGMDVALVLVVLGLIAGLALTDDRMVLNVALVIALPIIGAALTHIPTIGAQLNAAALYLQMAIAGAVATAIAIRMYHLTMDGVMGLTGMAAGRTAAPAAR